MGKFQLWNQRDLDYMRQVQNDNLPDSAVITRPTDTSNGKGGYDTTWAVVGYFGCRVHIHTRIIGNVGQTHKTGDKESSQIDVIITLPWDADVKMQDRIEVTFHETGETVTYDVTGLDNNPDSISTATRVKAESWRP